MLTSVQQTTLKNDITADPVLLALAQQNTAIGYQQIADAYNSVANPNFFVWKSIVTQDEIMQNGFDWVRVDNLAVGKARIWEWMFSNEARAVNPSKANVRAGIAEVWKGTAADNAVRQVVFNHCQRLATRLEKLFASGGTGATTSVDGVGPATMAVEGLIDRDAVERAWLNG